MEKYKSLGLKLTPQRLAILDYLEGNKQHPSAEDIYTAVSAKYPTMSFATVYNTMDALAKIGNVTELKIDNAKKRFDPDTSSHNHLICLKCKAIKDVFTEYTIEVPSNQLNGFKVTHNQVEFYGICENCDTKSNPN